MLFAYVQDLNPLGNRVASTLVAALPVVVLFYLLVGRRWLASWAGAAGAVVAILLAWLVYQMPLEMAGWAFVHGAVFGLLPIGWTVFAAMMLYNVTVETGQFDRVECILVARIHLQRDPKDRPFGLDIGLDDRVIIALRPEELREQVGIVFRPALDLGDVRRLLAALIERRLLLEGFD